MLGKEVHGLQELVQIDERANHDETTQNAPTPVSAGANTIVDATARQFLADSVADSMVPDQRDDAASEPRENKVDQTIVHGLFAVITTGNNVDIGANNGHNNQSIDATSDDGQQDKL